MAPQISYAQRYEDTRLLRCFGAQQTGFYIDIGAGHPVYDNVSFAFYLRGWHGITVEPNPWLAKLSEAVRPRDIRIESLVGSRPGEATYYLVEDFHGLSTTVETHARAAHDQFGKASKTLTLPVTTLARLCERHTAPAIDFLKIDVEGAEREVLAGGDWQRFRPKVVVAEAVAPVTLAPAWEAWEPMLLGHGYKFAFFDGLNRYYTAEEHGALATAIAEALPVQDVPQFRGFGPAAADTSHPDHRLARMLAGLDPVQLPLLDPETIIEHLIKQIDLGPLARPVSLEDVAAAHARLFGAAMDPDWASSLRLSSDGNLRDLCRAAVQSEPFRAACGRISASSAW